MKIYNTASLNTEQNLPHDEDALFAAWSEDRQTTSPLPLREWVSRYPQHAPTLVAWAADMPLLDCALENAPPDPAGEARTLAVGRQALAEMRAQYFAIEFALETSTAAKAVTARPLDDLLQTAKARGLNAKTLAARLDVGLPLVAKLNQRLVRLATIPDSLLHRLASELETGVEQVRAYLARPATLASGAQYKSDSVPQAAPPEDFAACVRACSDMTDDQKRFWLEQE